MEYEITACPSYGNLGLCNQLCLVLNAIEQAFQVISIGVGVVLKSNIGHASYGDQTIETFPLHGYQVINNHTILQGHDPMPGIIKYLDIHWKHEVRTNVSRYQENQYIHWLDTNPSSICIYIDKFIEDYRYENKKIPYTEILDFEFINKYLAVFGIRIEYKDIHLSSSNVLYHMVGANTPRLTLLFRRLMSNLRFHPSFYETVATWLGDKPIHHVIHLRNEIDAISHWSELNKMDPSLFQDKLNSIYIKNIETYIDKKKSTFVLTSRKEHNPIIEWMKQEGYNLCVCPSPHVTRREVSAIYDMIIASYCRDVFIGAYHIDNMRMQGSTFSYFICNSLPANVQKILINMVDIDIN